MIVPLAELTCLLALAWITDRVTSTWLRPQWRHALWTLVVLRMLLPAGVPGLSPSPVTFDAALMPQPVAAGSPALGWVMGVWALGALVLLTRWAVQGVRARRRLLDVEEDAGELSARLATVAPRVGLRRVPAVRLDPQSHTPYVTGVWSPCLMLPGDWREWPGDTLDHALAHELRHIARRDLLAEALWMLIACAYWFHPLVHAARRRAHEAREMCCDADVAIRLGPGYRRALLWVLASAAEAATPALASASGHAWHPAIARLHALDRWPPPAPWRARLAGAALLAAAAFIVLPAHLSVVPRAAAVPVEELLDPAARQERGMGSLHLRYALLAAEAARAADSPE
jgi:beta-lactamase regulating signal transducer with metallopeptidase domain